MKIFIYTATLLGAVIGAGFVGGKEIVLFFNGSITEVLQFAIVFALCCCISVKRIADTQSYDLPQLLKSTSPDFTRWMFSASYIVVLTTMLCGANDCFTMLTDINLPIGAVLVSLVCVAVMRKEKGMAIFNCIAVPVIVVFLIVALMSLPETPPLSTQSTVTQTPIVYALFNYAMCLSVLGSCTPVKNKFVPSLLCTVVIALLIGTLAMRIDDATALQSLPLLYLIKDNTVLYSFGIVAMCLAIVTSVLANLCSLTAELTAITKDRTFSLMTILSFCCVLSVGGYDTIVKYCYPVIALLGLFVALSCVFKIVTKKTVNVRSLSR